MKASYPEAEGELMAGSAENVKSSRVGRRLPQAKRKIEPNSSQV